MDTSGTLSILLSYKFTDQGLPWQGSDYTVLLKDGSQVTKQELIAHASIMLLLKQVIVRQC